MDHLQTLWDPPLRPADLLLWTTRDETRAWNTQTHTSEHTDLLRRIQSTGRSEPQTCDWWCHESTDALKASLVMSQTAESLQTSNALNISQRIRAPLVCRADPVSAPGLISARSCDAACQLIRRTAALWLARPRGHRGNVPAADTTDRKSVWVCESVCVESCVCVCVLYLWHVILQLTLSVFIKRGNSSPTGRSFISGGRSLLCISTVQPSRSSTLVQPTLCSGAVIGPCVCGGVAQLLLRFTLTVIQNLLQVQVGLRFSRLLLPVFHCFIPCEHRPDPQSTAVTERYNTNTHRGEMGNQMPSKLIKKCPFIGSFLIYITLIIYHTYYAGDFYFIYH